MIFVKSEDSNTVDSESLVISDEESSAALTEAQITLNGFWPTVMEEIKRIKQVDGRNQVLPLARIKKIMKLDDDVKMISGEAPLLFARACEMFIHELTLRAWVHTEDNRRRTLQRNDIAMAIAKCDQFDFLIDIVPREEAKPGKKPEYEPKATVLGDQVQYYLQLSQHQNNLMQPGSILTATTNPNSIMTTGIGGGLTINSNMCTPSVVTATTSGVNIGGGGGVVNSCGSGTIQIHGQQPSTTLTLAAPQNYLVTNAGGQQQTIIGNLQHHQQQQTIPPQFQLVQQIITATGEIQHVPINIPQNQLNLIRMQMQNQANQHPIIIQTAPMQQQQQQILQVTQNHQLTSSSGGGNPNNNGASGSGTGNVFLNTTSGQQTHHHNPPED